MNYTSNSENGVSTFAAITYDGTHDSFMRIGAMANQLFADTEEMWKSFELFEASVVVEDKNGALNILYPGMVFLFGWNRDMKKGGCLVIQPENEDYGNDESLYAEKASAILLGLDLAGDMDIALSTVFDFLL